MFRVQERHICNSILYHRPSITTINLYFRKFIATFIALTTIVIVSCNCNYYTVSSFHLIVLPSSTRRTINSRPTQFIEYNKRKITTSLKGSSSNPQKFSFEPKQKKNQTTIKKNTAKKRTKRNHRNKVDNTLKQVKKDDINKLVEGLGLTPVITNTNKDSKLSEVNKKIIKSKKPSQKLSSGGEWKDWRTNYWEIPLKTELQYVRNGHTVLRNVLNPSILNNIRHDIIEYVHMKSLDAWKQKVEVSTSSTKEADSCETIEDCKKKLTQMGILSLPFLQYFNVWESIPSVKELVTSPYLGKIAAQLMDVKSVRLYQDSVFHKRVEDGPTPWHSDARMAPFDTSNMITFWIPLQHIPSPKNGGTGLIFVDKSHSDFALPYWNEYDSDEYSRLDLRYGTTTTTTGEEQNGESHHMPLNVGDITVHAGWTLHCANGNSDYIGLKQNEDRIALAVSFVDTNAEIRAEVQSKSHGKDHYNTDLGDNEDQWSFKAWVNDVEARSYFEHDLVPIIWPPTD